VGTVILAFIAAQAVRLLAGPVLFALAAGCACERRSGAQRAVRAELKTMRDTDLCRIFCARGSNLQLDVLAEMWPWALLRRLRVAGCGAGCAGRERSSSRR